MTPKPYRVAVQELRKDAVQWDTAEQVMHQVQRQLGATGELSAAFGVLGIGKGADQHYERLNWVLINLASQAVWELKYGGTCLRRVAAAYEAADDKSVRYIRKSWYL